MSGLVERLTELGETFTAGWGVSHENLFNEAAAEIERLRAALRDAHRLAYEHKCWEVVGRLDGVLSGKGE